MATSAPLFNALASAKFTHKYEVVWAELSGAEFNTRTKAWLKLLGKVIGGPSSKERKALAQEFLQFLYVYKQMLEKLTQGTHSPEPALVLQKMNDFNAEYVARSAATNATSATMPSASSSRVRSDIYGARSGSRSVYPTSRIVWISGGPCLSSFFRR